jgi:hypothetical protein
MGRGGEGAMWTRTTGGDVVDKILAVSFLSCKVRVMLFSEGLVNE